MEEPILPLIPLAPLLSPNPSALKTETARALLSAFRHSGFLYLTTYSDLISPTLLEEVFTQSARFFARPSRQKNALAWTTPRANRGYTRMGREKTSHALTVAEVEAQRLGEGEDMKESFEIGREGELGCPNQWLEDAEDGAIEFRSAMLDFHAKCKDIHRALMRGIAIGLDLEEAFFDRFTRQGDNTLRLLHYPPVPAGGFDGPSGKRVRAGAHSDFGSLTLLFQDARGGLQVDPQGSGKDWADVNPIDDTIVVNAGDLLARWSNDLIRSTRHRVVEPPTAAAPPSCQGEEEEGGGNHPARYSIAYFCNPDFDGFIEAIPGTWEGEEKKKYPGVNSGDYLEQRLTATY